MSSGRYAFVIGLGIATYLAAQDPAPSEPSPAPTSGLKSPAASPAPAPVVLPTPSTPVVVAALQPIPRPRPPEPPPPPVRSGPSETELALMAQLDRLNVGLDALTHEVAELNRQKIAPVETAAVRRTRPGRSAGPDVRLDPLLGAGPAAQPQGRRAELDPSAVLELARVTELLMQRIEKLEKE